MPRFPLPWSVEELDACFVVRDANGQALDCHINATTTRLTAVSVGIGLRRAAALLCAADWIKQEAQGAAGSLGGQTVRGFFIH